MADIQRLSRRRGRPSGAAKHKTLESYPGLSLDECLSLDEATVNGHFTKLQVEPRPHKWPREPEYWFARYDGTPANLTMELATDEELVAHRVEFDKTNCRLVRIQLFAAFVERWVKELEHSALIAQIESRTGERHSESQLRYGQLANWHSELEGLLFHEAVQTSKLYAPGSPPSLGVKVKKAAATKGRTKA